MCGISGIISQDNEPIKKIEIEKMTDIISHRGPDGFGYYHGYNFAFGHRRLAIIDVTKAAHQPMHYLGKYTIVFNGEIYNFTEIKEELKKDGYIFKSNSDTEVVLASYDKWGENCVEHFNGMWAFAIHDMERDIIFCSRDRFGIKPFYYTKIKNKFAFGSEIKQFTVVDGWKAKINFDRAYDFLLFARTDHTEETLFNEVYQLRGGYNLVYNLKNHHFNIYQWYNLRERATKQRITLEEGSEVLRRLLVDSVSLRLRSDVKVGSCLSGGLDSSSIVCIANDLLRQQNANDKQETVSSCYEMKKYDEQEFIDEVVKKTGVISHRVFPHYEGVFKSIDKVMWQQDEPFNTTSIFAQWNVFKEANRNNIKVMLDGQGADEQLAGYHLFYPSHFEEMFRRLKLYRFKREIDGYVKLHSISNVTARKVFKRKIQYNLGIIKNEYPVRHWIDVKQTESIKKRNKFFNQIYKNTREMSYDQLTSTNLPMLLRYEDRDSMAHSIEARVPFLDYRIVEHVVKLPNEYKIRDGKTKYILRKAMKNILPEKIVNRYDKMGFVTPEDIWIKQNVDEFRIELEEACRRLYPILDESKVLKWFNQIISSNSYIDSAIWRIVAIGRWVKVFNVEVS